jgi:nitrate ABC transporter ATP-binding subunit
MAFLQLQDVRKSFETPKGRQLVLQGVDLAVEQGEFVAIVGYSGSGKTTLLSLIAGLIASDEGEISLEGVPIQGAGPDRGIVFQNYSLLPWLTVFENIYLAVDAVSSGLSTHEKRVRTEQWVRLVHLEEAMAKRPHEISGGMRQRVAVARGLAMDPKLLLLDEPFSALDALTRAILQDELARIWMEQRKTVLMVTHDVDEALFLADRIVMMTSGPAATVGEILAVHFPRPRCRVDVLNHPDYYRLRDRLIAFLEERATMRV